MGLLDRAMRQRSAREQERVAKVTASRRPPPIGARRALRVPQNAGVGDSCISRLGGVRIGAWQSKISDGG